MELKMFNRIAEILQPAAGTIARHQAEIWLNRVDRAATCMGYTICDLKPLAELLSCEPGELLQAARRNTMPNTAAKFMYAAIAQALNWERTEFDTLDELLEELRASEAAHSNDALMEEAFEVLKKVESLLDAIPTRLQDHEDETFATIGRMVNGKRGLYHVVRDFATKLAMRNADSVSTRTHTLLRAGELYRDVTILLHTEQLVAWRTADGQEYSAKAHQVLFDPDEDGLAAAILSRIAGAEIAPEHTVELRAQMAGGVK